MNNAGQGLKGVIMGMIATALRFGLAVLGVSLLAGCAGWRPVRQPGQVPEQGPPEHYLQSELGGAVSDEPWWPALGDSTLNKLMAEAFAENLTLEQAAARLDQFRAGYASARSTWVPWLSAQGNWTESGDVGDPDIPGAGLSGESSALLSSLSSTSSPRHNFMLTATYELDVWGQLAAGRAAAYADLLAGEENLRALTLILSAQVARTYFQIVELMLQQDLLRQTVSSYENSHELALDRYRRGIVPSLDVYQAETNLAGARAQKALVESNVSTAEHALAVLLGRYPESGLVPQETAMPGDLEDVPPGLPSELVQRRPDVRVAYWQLVAADRRAAKAVAQRLPSFNLTGSINGCSDDLGKALDPDNMIWSAIGNIVLPLFEGGRRKANADRAEAAWRERMASYKQAVLFAFQDVENALATGNAQKEYATQLEAQVHAAEASQRLATDRYAQGVSDYLPVVVAQTIYLNARRNLISSRRGLVDVRIALVISLGGGWTRATIEKYVSTRELHTED